MSDKPRGILLDVEGTTSMVSYVYDVMFPFARRGLGEYLDTNWDSDALTEVRQQVASDAKSTALGCDRQAFEAEIVRLMDADIKATGLKQLQGLVWQAGFASGELVAHVFDDVPPAFEQWKSQGIDLRVYSSGSAHAQRLFFAHSKAGNLLGYFSGHYDTTIGPKREAESYERIAKDWELAPGEILFLSDVVAELDAAREAGMQTGLCLRPGNAEVEPGHGHAELQTFAEVVD
ncbi:acireductone synthase [Aeoliella mucimassa]|uniref:Enolase-phosphatase E1 n=1 Tax=Aeoliella mucimassa TaxID=2527972 RepID=A0A518AKW5_9BACT|nr:acireductone synthase [Aeoliella mucimassa]QDU55372.1 Enolase-phosphatase E1 [Aeoliella mucimassa]